MSTNSVVAAAAEAIPGGEYEPATTVTAGAADFGLACGRRWHMIVLETDASCMLRTVFGIRCEGLGKTAAGNFEGNLWAVMFGLYLCGIDDPEY